MLKTLSTNRERVKAPSENKLFILLVFFLAGFLFFNISSAEATNYYVKNGGSDANTGLSDEQAWAHHPWMEDSTGVAAAAATTLTDGDVVYMARGSSWVYTSGLVNAAMYIRSAGTADYITTMAYGTGDKPLIWINYDTSLPIIKGDTSSTVSYLKFENLELKHHKNYYDQATQNGSGISIGINAADSILPHHIRINNMKIWNFSTSGIVISKGHHIYIGDENRTSTVTSTDYDNEISNFGYYAIGVIGRSGQATDEIFVYGNYIHDGDVNGSGPASYNQYAVFVTGSAVVGFPRNVYVRYNYVNNLPSWECIDTHGASEFYVEYNRVNNCSTHFALFAHYGLYTGNPGPIYVRYNTAHNDPDFVTTNNGHKYFFEIAPSTAGANADFFISDNIVGYTSPRTTGTAIGFAALTGYFKSLTIDRNTYENGRGGIGFYFGAGAMNDTTISRNKIIGTVGVHIISGAGLGGFLKIFNNIFDVDTYGFYTALASIDFNLQLFNNIIHSSNASLYGPIRNLGAEAINSHVIEIKNNVVDFKTPTVAEYINWLYTPGVGVSTPIFSNNLYYNTTITEAGNKFKLGATNYNLTSWQSSVESTALETNPLFISSSDYHLGPTSPAINAGTDVGLTSDFAGTSIPQGSAPDIGAYEYYPLTVTINQSLGQTDPSNSSTINFTVVFSESVSDFITGDVTLSGTAGANTATVTGSGATYNVAVTGMTGPGTVIASIDANKVTGPTGNINTASTSTDNTVSYDNVAPANVGISSITVDSTSKLIITAQTAVDSGSGLHATPYYFSETSGNAGGSSSSDWQASTTFIDDNLSCSTQYTYKVKVRDANGNESAFSDPVSASTDGCSSSGSRATKKVIIPTTPAPTITQNTLPSSEPSTYNFGTTTLRNGSRGEVVKELQRFLNTKLNLGLVVDGIFGPKTLAIVKQWQKDNGLVVDGLVGPKTKAKMNAK